MRPEDRAYLWDMREAVTEIANVVTTMAAQDFEEARIVRFGVERLVIILGEAAACVSEETRAEIRSIPWRQLQRLRNTMAHTYGKGNALELYRTARELLVPLSVELGALIPNPPKGEPDRSI